MNMLTCWFFSENVLTPSKLWESTIQLRDACLPLKFKRKIKKQLMVISSVEN